MSKEHLLESSVIIKVIRISDDFSEAEDENERIYLRDKEYPKDVLVYRDNDGLEYGLMPHHFQKNGYPSSDGYGYWHFYPVEKSQLVLFPLFRDERLGYIFGVDLNWKDFFRCRQQKDDDFIIFEGKRKKIRVFVRSDWLGMHTTYIAVDRANKPCSPLVSPEPEPCSDKCVFSLRGGILTLTPQHQIYHRRAQEEAVEGIVNKNQIEAISIRNAFAFMTGHWLTIPLEHPERIAEITVEHIMIMLKGGREIARMLRAKKSRRIKGIDGGWNWGKLAGCSKWHIHFQWYIRTLLSSTGKLFFEERCTINKLFKKYRVDIFELLMKEMRLRPFYCWENEGVFVFIPPAPMYAEQVDIIVKRPIPNLLELPDEFIRPIAEGIHKTIICLNKVREVKDFNLVVHQDDFEPKSKCYRLHFHIFPRHRGIQAIAEIEGGYVIDIFPETTARIMRKAMSEMKCNL